MRAITELKLCVPVPCRVNIFISVNENLISPFPYSNSILYARQEGWWRGGVDERELCVQTQ